MQYITYSLLSWISTWCSIWHCYIFQLDSKNIWLISLESIIKISFLVYFWECHCNCIFHVLSRHHWVKSLCAICVPEPVLRPIINNLHSMQITFSCNTVPAIEITIKFYKYLIPCEKYIQMQYSSCRWDHKTILQMSHNMCKICIYSVVKVRTKQHEISIIFWTWMKPS